MHCFNGPQAPRRQPRDTTETNDRMMMIIEHHRLITQNENTFSKNQMRFLHNVS